MSERMAWAAIAALSGEDPVGISQPERSRLRNRLAHLREDDNPAALLSSWMPRRGDRRRFSAPSPDALDFVRDDPRIALSGISDPRSGISGGSVVEGWVRKPEDIDDLIADHLLLPNIAGHVVLHVGRNIDGPVPIGLVMADLADWNGPREDGEVTRLVTRT